MKNVTKTGLLFLSVTLSHTVHSEGINFCNAPDVNREWERLIKEHGSSPEWQHMYRLRKQLCADIELGKISLESATKQFEDVRIMMIEKLRKKIEKEYGERSGTS